MMMTRGDGGGKQHWLYGTSWSDSRGIDQDEPGIILTKGTYASRGVKDVGYVCMCMCVCHAVCCSSKGSSPSSPPFAPRAKGQCMRRVLTQSVGA